MGWCSATIIFDNVCDSLLSENPISKKEMLKRLIMQLEDGDWDCQEESEYFDDPLVAEIFKELHPKWYTD